MHSLILCDCFILPDASSFVQDATANDFPHDTFDVKGFPTIYFRSASGNIVVYEGDRTKEDIISFIDKNKDTAGEAKKEEEKTREEAKDELWKDKSVFCLLAASFSLVVLRKIHRRRQSFWVERERLH